MRRTSQTQFDANAERYAASAALHAVPGLAGLRIGFLDRPADDIRVADGARALVTSRHALHDFHGVQRFLAEMRRILMPQGRFVLGRPDRAGPLDARMGRRVSV